MSIEALGDHPSDHPDVPVVFGGGGADQVPSEPAPKVTIEALEAAQRAEREAQLVQMLEAKGRSARSSQVSAL
jgi:hypothetical protein